MFGCTPNRLENSYFENTSSDSFSDAIEIYDGKINRALNVLKTYYPRSGHDEVMWLEDSYINLQISSKDVIYRQDFINYHLSDDREYMRYSDLYYLLDYSTSRIFPDQCSDIKEGELCIQVYDTHDIYPMNYPSRSGIRFYMDGDSVLINHFYTMNQATLYNYIFYFYKDESYRDVMEMTLLISNLSHSEFQTISHTKLVFGDYEETYRFKNCTTTELNDGTLEMEYLYTKFKDYDTSDLKHNEINSFIHLYINIGSTHGTIYDGLTKEKYDVSYHDGNYSAYNYTQYIRNTEVVSYFADYYKVNLQEIIGWDNLRRNQNGTRTFDLYYEEENLSNGEDIQLSYTNSEYPYYEHIGAPNSESVIDLSIIGLSTDYTTNYFMEKLSDGATLMEQTLIDRDLNHSYEDLVDMFKSIIFIPDFDFFEDI